jgi:ASC-1-like (ASCH) protein
MATYDANLHIDAFEQMEASRKTVYTVIAVPEYSVMSSGDRLEFGSFGSITIGMVRRYKSLDELVATEGWQSLVPDASDGADAIQQVRDIAEWDEADEKQYGVLALRVRSAKRKDR